MTIIADVFFPMAGFKICLKDFQKTGFITNDCSRRNTAYNTPHNYLLKLLNHVLISFPYIYVLFYNCLSQLFPVI